MKTKEKIKINPVGIIIVVILLLTIFLFLLIKLLIPKTFVVSFDSMGGTVVNSVKVKENDKISKPSNPVREGFLFAGWYLNDELFDFNTEITESIVLEAKWSGDEINVAKIILENSELNLKVNATSVIKYTIEPDNATDKTIKFTSSDSSVVTVDSQGNIKALKVGEAVITLTSNDGQVEAKLKIIVTNDESTQNIKVEGVSISGNSKVLVGKTLKLTANVKPANATNKEVTWSSSNESVATVDQSGNVKALSVGTTTITVVTTDGNKKATKKITVIEEDSSSSSTNVDVTDIKISGDKEVTVGAKIKLEAKVSPDNASDKTIIWSSSNESVATVDQSGNVTGVTPGIVKITATSHDGKVSTTYEITVKAKEAIYVLYLKASIMDNATGSISQYSFRVTKDGTEFTGYKGFTYNNKSTLKTSGTLRAVDINKDVKTATLILSDGSRVNAEVRYE